MAKAKLQQDNALGTMPNWDLSDLYKNQDDPALAKDLKWLADETKNFQQQYNGKLSALDAKQMLAAVKQYEHISDVSGRIASFSYLTYATDMQNEATAIFFQNTSEKLTEFSTALLFFSLQINQLEEAHLEKILQHKELESYRPWFRDLRVWKKYQLSDKEEEILTQTSITSSQAWNRLFDETSTDLRFPFKDKILTCSEILHKLSEPEAEDRMLAGQSLGKVLGENIKLFTLITNVLAKDKQISDSLRKFPKPISSRNTANYVEDEVVEALINTVKSAYPKLSHRYYKLKASWFGKKQLDYWDRNAPIPGKVTRVFSWQEAVDIVLAAYGNFSPKLREVAENFFKNNWIDVPPKVGKRDGAFAHPTVPSVHPYLMLNYFGKTRDVMTLAHELGHGVHQVLSASQGPLMCDTPLTLAETASVFGEQLTFRYLLNQEADAKTRKFMIAAKVEDMLNTVVRQIAFCEFERELHDERKSGELSSERISAIWLKTQQESLGSSIILHEEYKNYWAYIPHFVHSPFYVYSYAFGDCLVNSLYQNYLDGMPNFEEKYLQMLQAGGTKWHKQLLQPLGLDASKAAFWQSGLKMIENFIDELEK